MAPEDELVEWLGPLGVYGGIMVQNGYDSLEVLVEMTEEQVTQMMNTCGVQKEGHRTILQNKIKSLRGTAKRFLAGGKGGHPAPPPATLATPAPRSAPQSVAPQYDIGYFTALAMRSREIADGAEHKLLARRLEVDASRQVSPKRQQQQLQQQHQLQPQPQQQHAEPTMPSNPAYLRPASPRLAEALRRVGGSTSGGAGAAAPPPPPSPRVLSALRRAGAGSAPDTTHRSLSPASLQELRLHRNTINDYLTSLDRCLHALDSLPPERPFSPLS